MPRPFAKDETDFISCKAFGKSAEFLENYKHQGDEIAIAGRIQSGSYKNRDGNTVYTTDVVCDRVESTYGAKGGNDAPRREEKRDFEQGELPDSFDQLDEDMPFN